MSSSRAMQRLCGLMRKAVQDYEMIAPGDKVMVGVSGGKDSVALTIGLAELRKYIGFDFTVQAVTLDPQFGGRPMDYTVLQELFAQYDIPYEIRRTEIGPVVFDYRKEKNPCALCAKLRRGALHTAAQELGCNKIALGQHLDDIEISFLMSICRGSGLSTMGPNVPAEEHALRVIRPLAYTPESLIIQMASEMELPRRGECIYREQLESSGDRAYFRSILEKISEKIPDLRSNLLRSLSNIQEEYLLDRRFIHAANKENPNETD